MRFALRWLASGFVAALIAMAFSQFLPPQPVALHLIGFVTLAAVLFIALSWKVRADARGLAIVLGLSLALIMGCLTLFIQGAWAPWF
jgi:hypothetical protein